MTTLRLLACALLLLAATGCGGDDLALCKGCPTPTVTPTSTATPTSTPTPGAGG